MHGGGLVKSLCYRWQASPTRDKFPLKKYSWKVSGQSPLRIPAFLPCIHFWLNIFQNMKMKILQKSFSLFYNQEGLKMVLQTNSSSSDILPTTLPLSFFFTCYRQPKMIFIKSWICGDSRMSKSCARESIILCKI